MKDLGRIFTIVTKCTQRHSKRPSSQEVRGIYNNYINIYIHLYIYIYIYIYNINASVHIVSCSHCQNICVYLCVCVCVCVYASVRMSTELMIFFSIGFETMGSMTICESLFQL